MIITNRKCFLKQNRSYMKAITLTLLFCCLLVWKAKLYSKLYPEHSNNVIVSGIALMFSFNPKDVEKVFGGFNESISKILN